MRVQPFSLAVLATIALLSPCPGDVFAQDGPPCDPDNGGLTLPPGFCAHVVADSVGRARHLVVAPNGDIFVATRTSRDSAAAGGVLALRDTDGDGRA
ncbi:MAG: cytochrome C, partial [Gemmatimonadota bacterium]